VARRDSRKKAVKAKAELIFKAADVQTGVLDFWKFGHFPLQLLYEPAPF
jgi:hypothetical protein